MALIRFRIYILVIALLLATVPSFALSFADSTNTNADSLRRTAASLHATGHYAEAISAFLSAGADTGDARDCPGLEER